MTRKRPPLIAHVIYRFDIGGLENGLVNLINGMPEDRYRHAIVCIDRATAFSGRLRGGDVELVSIHKKPGRDPAAAWRLYRVFRRLEPDILHTRNLGALDALLPAFLAGVKWRIHGEHGWDVSDHQATSRKNRLIRRMHAPLVTTYIALSRQIEDYLCSRVGIDRRKIARIPNGVDTRRFRPAPDRASLKTALFPMFDADTRIIGTVCRLDPVKDPLNLLNAYACLLEASPKLRERTGLVVVGDGPMRGAVEQELDRLAIRDRSLIAGSREDVPALLQAMDVFVMPSLAEGISNTILEAMATGLPVLATDVGGNRELIVDGETGTVVPSSDPRALALALVDYVQDEAMAEGHGRAGRERVEDEFSLDTMVDRYVAVYDSLLGEQQRAHHAT